MTQVLSSQKDLNSATKSLPALTKIDQIKALVKMQHDIRTPMHVVKGLTGILATSSPLTSRQKEMVTALESSAGELCTLVDQMLAFIQVTLDNQDSPFVSRPSSMQENKRTDKEPSI